MIRKKIIRLKNPKIAKVGYHVTSFNNLTKIRYEGFKRNSGEMYLGIPLRIISYYFFGSKRPVYFLDIPDLKKITPSMKGYLLGKDFILKIDVENYNQEPDYNMLVIDYNFKILDKDGNNIEHGFSYDKNLKKLDDYYIALNDTYLKKYKDLYAIYKKYGHRINYYTGIKLKDIKNNNEIKTHFIFFTETFCVNKNIPKSKILDYYEIER